MGEKLSVIGYQERGRGGVGRGIGVTGEERRADGAIDCSLITIN
jgi:hypothetical protein